MRGAAFFGLDKAALATLPSFVSPQGILLLSAGSKLAIARIAKQSAIDRGLALHASDTHPAVPARLVADAFVCLPPSASPDWAPSLLDYCSRHRIGLVIPTRHADLPVLAAHRNAFADQGIALPLSDDATLKICLQKLDTHAFLQSIGSPTPLTTAKSSLPQSSLASQFPLFAKPASGAASTGARIVHNADELLSIPENWILQTLAKGDEYTINLYLDRHGQPICSIPHHRIAVEAGEVTQARTQRLPELILEAERIARALPRACGIINIQAFRDPADRSFQIIEINPRIGGGFPLAHQAKGHFIEWLCQEWIDGATLRPFSTWTENLLMLRYREAMFEISDT